MDQFNSIHLLPHDTTLNEICLNSKAEAAHLVTGAVIGTDGIPTNLLTPAVIRGTFILVRKENCSKPIFLYRVVGEKLESQTISFGGNNLHI